MLATACCSVVLLEEEVTRREEMIQQAANIQADLSTKLSAHQKRLEVQEQRFEKIASRAHVGIWVSLPDGTYTYRNDRWFDIFQIAREEHLIQHAWPMLIEEEDLKACEHEWLTLAQNLTPISFELRLRHTFHAEKDDLPMPSDSEEHKMWILISAYPELADDGSLKGDVYAWCFGQDYHSLLYRSYRCRDGYIPAEICGKHSTTTYRRCFGACEGAGEFYRYH